MKNYNNHTKIESLKHQEILKDIINDGSLTGVLWDFILYRCNYDHDLAKDLLQDCLLEVLSNINIKNKILNVKEYKNDPIDVCIKRYAGKIANNLTCQYFNSKYYKNEKKSEKDDFYKLQEDPYTAFDMFRVEKNTDISIDIICKGFEGVLTEKRLLILTMHLEGKSYKEISIAAGINVGGVGEALSSIRENNQDYRSSVIFFEKYGNNISKNKLMYVAELLGIGKINIFRYYNSWLKNF
ncbi:hypothetical protein [Kordia sp.]|uniref:hypothetical protein n=1 Tax=Kordia sp. TaxID=1965332 RepID=UPI003D6A3F0B